jgi:hypothetical protein
MKILPRGKIMIISGMAIVVFDVAFLFFDFLLGSIPGAVLIIISIF